MLIAIALLAACVEQAPAPCADAPCRLAQVRERWAAPPLEVAGAIDALPSALERGIAFEAYFLEHGERVDQRAFCEALSLGPTRQRCGELTGRPHLGDEGRQDGAPAQAAPGWQDSLDATAEGCAPDESTVQCATARAKGLAATQEPVADAPCAELTEPRWADECRMQVAAELILQHGTAGASRAIAVCGRTTVLHRMCRSHVSSRLAELAPDAATADEAAWADAIEVAAQLEGAWGDHGAAWADHYWSMALWFSMRPGVGVAPGLSGWLPAAAQPQLRSAAAWSLIEATSPEAPALERLVLDLAAKLEGAPITAAPDAPSRPALGYRRMQDLWVEPARERPSVHFQGLSRRLLAADESADAAVCLLEAAAQLPPPRLDLLREGLVHNDPAVRATAERLLGALGVPPSTSPVGGEGAHDARPKGG